MKVRRLNRKRAKKKDDCSQQKFKFVILQQANVISLLLLRVLEKYELSNSCKHFIRLIILSSVHLKPAREVAIFIF